MLVWNEQVVLPVQCDVAPVVELQLWRQRYTRDTTDPLDDAQIGYVSLPLFHAITAEQHLVAFTLPIVSRRSVVDDEDAGKKEGTLDFEVQFLDHQRAAELASTTDPMRIELVLHGMRVQPDDDRVKMASTAILQLVKVTSSAPLQQASVVLHEVPIQLSLDVNVDSSVDLTDALANTPDQDGCAVLALELCDIDRRLLARAHIPLRNGWQERLEAASGQRVWYSLVADDSQRASDARTEVSVLAKVQASFHVSSSARDDGETVDTIVGNVCVCVRVAVLVSDRSRRLAQSGSAARVRAWLAEDDSFSATASSDAKKHQTTRKALYDDNERSWKWANDTITLAQYTHQAVTTVWFELVVTSLGCALAGTFDVAGIGSSFADEWISLSSSGDDADEFEAHLLVRLRSVRARDGVLELGFGETRALVSPPIPVDRIFFKCTWGRHVYTTASLEDALAESSDAAAYAVRLEIPFDMRTPVESSPSGKLESTSWLLVQRMGTGNHLPEMCLGECTLDVCALLEQLPVSEIATGDVEHPQRRQCRWYALHASRDASKRVGFVKIAVTFRPHKRRSIDRSNTHTGAGPVQDVQEQKRIQAEGGIESYAAISEALTVWKKLFYVLDTDGNGRIDLHEFKSVFLQRQSGACVRREDRHSRVY